MKRTGKNIVITCSLFLLSIGILQAGVVYARSTNEQLYTIENDFLSRTVAVVDGKLKTAEIINKRAGNKTIHPISCDEFRIRISEGTHTTGTDAVLTTEDFQFAKHNGYQLPGKKGSGIVFVLKNAEHQLTVTVHYELAETDFYMRKHIEISSAKVVTLERIDVECITVEDAYQPYKLKMIYAQGKWSPGLGQPIFTTETATFWGTEFPAADNYVQDKKMSCGYLWGRQIEPNSTYKTYTAVLGVADDKDYISDAFYDYIGRIRVRPLRLRIQYNSWFDYGPGVNKDNFRKSVSKIANKPFQACVIDDGWQDVSDNADWSDKVWKVNTKFDPDFAHSLESVKQAKSQIGLWLSPECNFGAARIVPKLRNQGFEALESWMSLAGPKYMQALEKRMVELTRGGVSYFKLDGIFGHLYTREFDIYGQKHGLPYMPQLDLEGVKSNDEKLNDAKYDELKIYYLVAGSEKLIEIFRKMDEINHDVYIVISNGAWLSPWWMMHCDAVWMINAGDAAGGSTRTQELVYRDGVYYEIWAKENTHFPMNSLFNHEPKKTEAGEGKEVFRNYLYMNISRGTGFIELYIKTFDLQQADWDVLSEGLHWAYHIFGTFNRSRMHGGNPQDNQVYGFTGWNDRQGYVSIHNPTDKKQTYSFTLDRKFGLVPGSGPFNLTSPIERCVTGLKKQYSYGDTLTLELDPQGIIILNFDKDTVDWSALKKLQAESPNN